MSARIEAYLAKRAEFEAWPLEGAPRNAPVTQVIAIPALAECDSLFLTLEDLEAAPEAMRAQTLVIVVVNNTAAADVAQVDSNRRTLGRLAAHRGGLCLAWVDAASTGRELPPKTGVGLARKIGLDWGMRALAQHGNPHGGLICLDADTRVGPEYLGCLQQFFAERPRWGAVIPYAHPLDGPPAEAAAVRCYELFMRCQELALDWAGSPYAYPSVGSAMACSARACAAVSGMNRRQAGEDFYFLQQLAKTGGIERVRGTVVCPSSRPSYRVPFGTGRHVRRVLAGEEDPCLAYHPESYRVLRKWLRAAAAAPEASAHALETAAAAIHPELVAFLAAQRFEEAWPRLQANSGAPDAMRKRFHEWFDAFRTLKLLHHLRDHGHPRQDLFEAIAAVLDWRGAPAPFPVDARLRDDAPGQTALLNHLRGLCGRLA